MYERALTPCWEGETILSINKNSRNSFHVCFLNYQATSIVVVQAILENVALGIIALDLEKSNSNII